jgi:predicted N-acyltransferase
VRCQLADARAASPLASPSRPPSLACLQERKKSRQEGLRFLKLVGSQIQARHWEAFYSFYRNTTDRKGGFSYLTPEFFARLSERLGDRVLLVLAETDDPGVAPGEGEPVAGALNLIGSHALFGRNWGCRFGDRVPNLHMELCYFQVGGRAPAAVGLLQ